MKYERGYCKDCFEFIKGYCSVSLDILSATPLTICNSKKLYEMIKLEPNEKYNYLIGETIRFKCISYKILSISRITDSVVLYNLKNDNHTFMDLDLILNIYNVQNGKKLKLIEKDNREFMKTSFINSSELVSKQLDVSKIKNLDDIKIIIDLLDIKFLNINKNHPAIVKAEHLLIDIGENKENDNK